MQQFMAITKALSDENRVRVLLMLREGELCLCQIIEVLGLAPSTVSKHVELLRRAGLVSRRKEGRWHYYQLAGRGAPPAIRDAIRWSLKSLEPEAIIKADAAKLCSVRNTDLEELAECYNRT